MTAVAWVVVAAILLAWAAEAIWQHIDRGRDERDWQAMVDEAAAEHAALLADAQGDARDARTAQRTTERLATKSAQEAARLRQRLLLDLPRVFPAAPRSGEPPRYLRDGEASPIHDALVAERAADLPPSDLGKRRAAKRAVSKS